MQFKMLRKSLLVTAALCVVPMGAYAADDDFTIKVIHDDGSVDVLDLRSSAPAPEPAPEPAKAPEAAPPPAVEKAPVEKEAPVAPAPVPAADAPALAPGPADLPPTRVEPASEFAPKAAAAPKKQAKGKVPPPIPPVKPQRPAMHIQEPPQVMPAPVGDLPAAVPLQDEGAGSQGLSRKQAIATALNYAPPSSDVEVYRMPFGDMTAIVVVFKTDEGFYEVFLDPASGALLDRRAMVPSSASPQPGHLPGGVR